MSSQATPVPARHRVVVVGGGFGGIQAVKRLAGAPVEVTLVDRRNFHLFQPLTYQVATGALSPGEVAYPLRALFHRAKNVRVMLAEVTGFDLNAREVRLDSVGGARTPETLAYDSLVVAGGSAYSYFGHDEWGDFAPEVKSLESALETRSRILNAFEKAELEPDPDARRAELTFVVVGAGPTGVEMAGQIGEMARDTLRRDFRAIDPREARIVLVEAGERVLSGFPPSLSAKAERALAQLGVTTMLRSAVVGVDPAGVTLQREDNSEYLPASTVIWAAGVRASALAGQLASAVGAEPDRAGRVTVESDLTLPGHPEVIALGDMVRVRGAGGEVQQLPGVAPVAIQQGRYAGRLIANRVAGRETPPFHYRDKGNLATIGRARAVADLNFVRVSGPLAWLLWLGVHIFYLIGFQNRLLVLLRWGFSFVTRGRGARLITGAEAGGR
ncbi:MAG TPA: NAD(P)/FAD-dependent oxidoreductase [Thermoleophilaceae bacterium]